MFGSVSNRACSVRISRRCYQLAMYCAINVDRKKPMVLEIIENDVAVNEDETDISLRRFRSKNEVEEPRSVVQPVWPHKSYTVSPLIERSKTLKKLVDLGVDLSQLEPKYNVINFLMRLNWENDIMPRLKILLVEACVPDTALSTYVTKNPWIFGQDKDDLQTRLNFLEYKGFSKAAVSRIVSTSPIWLNIPVPKIDSRLKFYQKEFQLNDDELRYIITKNPNLIVKGTGDTKLLQFSIKEEMGFSDTEAKQLLINDPELWTSPKPIVLRTFDYLHNKLGLSHEHILSYPRALRVLETIIAERHEYLKRKNMAQYDREKANFVSLRSLVSGTDEEFCRSVAKCSASEYNSFSKLN